LPVKWALEEVVEDKEAWVIWVAWEDCLNNNSNLDLLAVLKEHASKYSLLTNFYLLSKTLQELQYNFGALLAHHALG
jgi:hypothetical protein